MMLPYKCRSVRKNLSRLLDQDLPDRLRVNAERHLASCDDCRTVYSQLRANQEALRQAPRGFDDSEAARMRVMARVRAETTPRRVPNWQLAHTWSAVAATAVFCAVAMAPNTLSHHAELPKSVSLPATTEIGQLFDLHDELVAHPETFE